MKNYLLPYLKWSFLFFASFFVQATSSNAQVKISGVVLEESTSEPLPYATVYGKDTKQGTIVDIDGSFELETDAEYLIISYIGFKEQEIKIVAPYDNWKILMKEEGVILGCPTIYAPPVVAAEHPAALMHIPPRLFKLNDQVRLDPILNLVTGVYMHTGALNTNRITIRGIGARSPFGTAKIRAYLDDIPLTSGVGETTIEDIDQSLINSATVWKGPSASIYGASLGGVVKLSSVNNASHPSSVSSSLTLGSYGLLRNSNTLQIRKSKFKVAANYSLTSSDGYRDNNDYNRSSANLNGHKYWGNSDRGRTSFLLSYTDLKAFIPSSLNETDYINEPSKAAFTWGNVNGFEDYTRLIWGVSHRQLFLLDDRNELYWTGSVFGSQQDQYESRPFNILEDLSTVVGARTKMEFVSGSQNLNFPTATIGMEYFHEKYDWQIFETNDGAQGILENDNAENRNYFNIFAESNINIKGQLNVAIGANLNSTKYELIDNFAQDSIDLSGNYKFETILSPRLGLNYIIDKDIHLYATVSHGFSPPSLEETLLPDGQINPNIQPEQGWNFEIGSRKTRSVRDFEFDFALFAMEIKDLLVSDRIAEDQYIGRNAGRTTHLGIEVYTKYYFSFIRDFPFNAFASYTYSDFRFSDFVVEDQDGIKDYSGNPLTGVPPHQLNAGVQFSAIKGFYGNVQYQFVDGFSMRDDNSISSDAYQTVNMKLGWSKFLGPWMFDVSAGINNLLDEKYASMILINAGSFGGNAPRYYYPGLPRNYYGSVKLGFRF